MHCRICNSNTIKKIESFRPYIDKDWSFDVYDCLACETRFA